MELSRTARTTTLVDRAIQIVMYENACDADQARSSLAGSATTHGLPLEEVAAAVLAVSGRERAGV